MLSVGTVMVEMKLCHEQRSPMRVLPSYPDDRGSCAYYVTILDPRPSLEKGTAYVYQFNVDEQFPKVTIPLSDEVIVGLDFAVPYQHTFEVGRWGDLIDYEQLPERFETYREDDQQRIRARMQAVIEARQKGLDLETGPFELPEQQL